MRAGDGSSRWWPAPPRRGAGRSPSFVVGAVPCANAGLSSWPSLIVRSPNRNPAQGDHPERGPKPPSDRHPRICIQVDRRLRLKRRRRPCNPRETTRPGQGLCPGRRLVSKPSTAWCHPASRPRLICVGSPPRSQPRGAALIPHLRDGWQPKKASDATHDDRTHSSRPSAIGLHLTSCPVHRSKRSGQGRRRSAAQADEGTGCTSLSLAAAVAWVPGQRGRAVPGSSAIGRIEPAVSSRPAPACRGAARAGAPAELLRLPGLGAGPPWVPCLAVDPGAPAPMAPPDDRPARV